MTDTDERVRQLEAAIADLRAEVAALRARRSDTMARTFQCPACGCKRVVHVRQISDVQQGVQMPFSLTHQVRMLSLTPGDPVEAFICRECRLVEWHVLGFELTDIDGEQAIEIASSDVETPPAPYR